MVPPSRRQALRWSALAAGSIPLVGLLAACASEADRRSGSARPRARSTATPSTPWWLAGNFGPVTREVEAFDLTVEGALPTELTGLYVRNGSNPQHADSSHWFFGDGMVHGIRLERGKARWYRNRYVHTALYDAGQGFGAQVPGGSATQSNVSAFWHGGALLTSGEVGFPYRVSPDDLSTVGIHDFGGALTSAFTAHPKIDPETGRLHSFGYGFTPPFLTYHVTEPDGRLVHSEVVDIPRSTMMHDFAITDQDVVFWDLPVVFDLDAATQWIEDPTSGAFPYRWDPSAGAWIGIMPLGGPASGITWHDIDPCFVFHGVNAHRDGTKVVLDVCRLSSMFAPHQAFGGQLSERRWTVDTATGRIQDDVVESDRPGELPGRDPRRVGRPNRYDYLVEVRDPGGAVDFGGVIKRDHRTGRRAAWAPNAAVHGGEWLFVPVGADEDAGYLLTYTFDDRSERSHLVVLDATDVTRGPVASVALPQRVPYGFHGTWVPACDAPVTAPGARPTSPFAPFRHRVFLAFWTGAFLSNIGTQMEAFAIGVYVTSRTGEAGWTGLVAAAAFVPGGLLGPVGGALADRFPRKTLLLTTTTIQTGFAAVLTVLAATGSPSPAVVTLIVFASGCANAIGFPAYQSVLPDLVPREDLIGAVALSSAQWNLGRVLGPVLAGLVVGFGGYAWAFGINTVSFLAVILAIMALRLPRPNPDGSSILRSIRQGLGYARRDPGLRVVVGYMLLTTFLAAPFIALLPYMSLEVLDAGKLGTSVLVATLGLGAVIMALSLGNLAARFGSRRVLLGAVWSMPGSLAVYAVMPNLALAAVGLFIVAIVYFGALSSFLSIGQLRAPTEIRGRVVSILALILGTLYPLGAVLQGEVADIIGLRETTLIAAGLMLLALVALWVRNPRFADALDEPPAPLVAAQPADPPTDAGPGIPIPSADPS